jgi:hypothetical protein
MMPLLLRPLYCLTAVALMVSLLGCSNKPALAKVTGTVTIDGKPLPQGTIIFETAGNRSATGKIVNGEILDVMTYVEGDGATVGLNKVAIVSTEEVYGFSGVANPGEKEPPKAKMTVPSSLVPKRYNDPNGSGLTADIKKGGNTVEFKLTSK